MTDLPTNPVPNFQAEADFSKTIGSTDVRRIMNGDWLDLYREKTGEVERDDLTWVFKPQLGLLTEGLHAKWHAHQTGDLVVQLFDSQLSRHTVTGKPSHYATSIDLCVHEVGKPDQSFLCVLELKHTNERASLHSSATYYMAQLQWQMYLLDQAWMRFSIIRGNNEPEWGIVERDNEFIDKMVGQVEAFWWHVENKEAPNDMAVTASPADTAKAAAKVPINGMRSYDMTGDNAWASAVDRFVIDKVASDNMKASQAALKDMVPHDAKEISGAGLTYKRDARGALRVSITDEVMDAARARLSVLLTMQEES